VVDYRFAFLPLQLVVAMAMAMAQQVYTVFCALYDDPYYFYLLLYIHTVHSRNRTLTLLLDT